MPRSGEAAVLTPLVLASTSRYRKELLARLRVPFEAVSPPYEEFDLPGLSGPERAIRHALGKARSVAGRMPGRLVIGSDQVAESRGEILGKPATADAAVAQLLSMAGRTSDFHTGVAVVRGGDEAAAVETVKVTLRQLSRAEIEAYVAADLPLDCAGSFRVEGLGIALMEAVEGRDYTALIGLPLIAVVRLLERFGVPVLLRAGDQE